MANSREQRRRQIRLDVNKVVANEIGSPGPHWPDEEISTFYPGNTGPDLWVKAALRIKSVLQRDYKNFEYDKRFAEQYYDAEFDEFSADLRTLILRSEYLLV